MFISLCRFQVLSFIRCKLFYAHSRVCKFVIFSYRVQQCVMSSLLNFRWTEVCSSKVWIRVIGVCVYNHDMTFQENSYLCISHGNYKVNLKFIIAHGKVNCKESNIPWTTLFFSSYTANQLPFSPKDRNGPYDIANIIMTDLFTVFCIFFTICWRRKTFNGLDWHVPIFNLDWYERDNIHENIMNVRIN